MIVEQESVYSSTKSIKHQDPDPAPQIKGNDELKDREIPVALFDDWQKIDFLESSVELLAFFDSVIQNEAITLHPWQVEVSEDLCIKYKNATSKSPHKFSLCAANGSGKDAFVIAPFALWFIVTKIKSLVIITSSSGVQLTNQTEKYIRNLADKINKWALVHYGAPILKINKRHIYCTLSGSEILLFATDQGEMAEGYHPTEPNAEMAIIVNEAKSIKQEIFDALRRCTGFNYWLNVSTPGEPIGDFHDSFENWKHKRRVTFFDCPHQSPDEFQEDLRTLGEHHPLFRSKWLALFTYFGGKYVISQPGLEALRRRIKNDLVDELKIDNKIRIGLDIALSGNGDETVISAFKNNRQIKQICERIADVILLTDAIDKHLRDELGLEPTSENYIFNADDGGVGRAVIDILRNKGWRVCRVLNQSASKNKRGYRNRGAELWDKFNRLVLKQIVILLDDERLYKQLSSRKYKESEAGIDKLCLQSKKEMIKAGLPSPDRADAAILAFVDIDINTLIKNAEHIEPKVLVKTRTSQEEMYELEKQLYGQERQREKREHCRFSLSVLLKRQSQNMNNNSRIGKYQFN